MVIFGGRLSSDPSDPELRVSYSTVSAFTRIKLVLEKLYGEGTSVTLKNLRDIDGAFTSTKNVVFLGGVVSIPRVKEIFELLPLQAGQVDVADGRPQIVMSDSYANTRLAPRMENGLVSEDHAFVTRIINDINDTSFFSVSGCWGPGTGAAVLALTNKDHFNRTGFSATARLNEVVVSAKNFTGNQFYKELKKVTCRAWQAQTLEDCTLSKVAQIVYRPEVSVSDSKRTN